MDWTSFLIGAIVGAMVFDMLWRVTMRWNQELIDAQREYIHLLRSRLGLEPPPQGDLP